MILQALRRLVPGNQNRNLRWRRLRKLTRKQAEFDRLQTHIKGFVGGRGVGKTEVGAHYLLKHAQPGDPALVVSPDYNVIQDTTWPTFQRVAEQTGQWLHGVKSPTPRAWFRPLRGGEPCLVVFRSAEKPDKLRGGSWALIWYDEASIMCHEAFTYSIPALRWRGQEGTILITMTPKGVGHWTFSLFFAEIDEGEREILDDDEDQLDLLDDPSRYRQINGRWYRQRENTGIVQAHSRENPFLPQTYEHDIGLHLSNALKQQELAGEFINLGGLYFRREWFERVNDVPRRAQRVRYYDRACLVAGTQVETIHGPLAIESIRPGDMVLTRRGYREVTWSGQTKTVSQLVQVEFANGAVLQGTPDHPVWTENRNWIRLDTLRAGDYIKCIPQPQGDPRWQIRLIRNSKLLCSTEDGTPESRGRDTTTRTSGTKTKSTTSAMPCIETSGSSTTVTSPKAITFITRTKIGTTTRRVILSASPGASTDCATEKNGEPRSIEHFLTASENCPSHPRGIKPKKLQSVGESVDCPHGQKRKHETTYARNAESRSSPERYESRDFAAATVGTKTDRNGQTQERSDSSTSYALSAGLPFGDGNEPDAALRYVQPNGDGHTGTVPVYDLTVEGEHEFYANGILVHNSTHGNGCWSVGTLMARSDDGIFYVEDVVRGQWSYQERNRVIVDTAHEDARKYGNEVQIWGEQEGGSAGKEVSQQFVKMLAGFPVHIDIVSGKGTRMIGGMELPHKPKLVRAQGLIAQAEAGNVKIKRAPWNEAWLDEHAAFGESDITDQVDSASGSLNKLCRMWTTDPGFTGRLETVADGERFGVFLDKIGNTAGRRR